MFPVTFAPPGITGINPNKLLIDPYAIAIAGTLEWNDAVFGYQVGHHDEDMSFSEVDSAPFVPKSVVVDHSFNWEQDKPPQIPYHQTIIYETHVKGFTQLTLTFMRIASRI